MLPVTPDPVVARRLKARYAFAGPGVEIDQTLPLESGEEPVLQGRVSVAYHRPVMVAGIGYVRLTSTRLCVNRLRALGANPIIEVPRGAFLWSRLDRPWWGFAAAGPRTGVPILRVMFTTARGPDRLSLMAFASLNAGGDTRGGVKKTVEDHLRGEGHPRGQMEELHAALTGWSTSDGLAHE
jgi:hypothetical protein